MVLFFFSPLFFIFFSPQNCDSQTPNLQYERASKFIVTIESDSISLLTEDFKFESGNWSSYLYFVFSFAQKITIMGEEESCQVLCGQCFHWLSKGIQRLFVSSTTTTTETTPGFSLSPPNSTSPKLVSLLRSLASKHASISGGLPI
ncbi:unnamed protein product [Thlaspi arvense]|uniref:Uncharacterized protein n=1 Tax=Thlaspi arvense TaxID=13288 RepID=A0AAU9RXI5_THLAR|nr:unnamed protein product [Thlaspi arvense]